MKNHLGAFLVLVLLLNFSSCKSIEEIRGFAPTEVFPNDTILSSIKTKKAMIVLAHDDDMCAMSGTISKLNSVGWEIRVISISKLKKRNDAQIKACKYILDSVLFFDFSTRDLRLDLDTNSKPYLPVNKMHFSHIFNNKVLQKAIVKEVNNFEPSVIFTLDNEVGGYGHPEHVFVSQTVLDLAIVDSISPLFIYQSVFTDHMENTIMKKHSERMKAWGFPGNSWDLAKERYNVEGMPEPSVQIDISGQAEQKMDYLRSYNKRERKIIGFFIPAFEDYSANDYFQLFNREFFRVIKIM